MIQTDEFVALLDRPEGSNIEFKSATGRFSFEELARYCVALANEGGGDIVLGVTDRRPRQVLGTQAFEEPGRTEARLFERLGHHVPIVEFRHEGHRVLVIRVPSRSSGSAWQDSGTFWMRAGDALVPMTDNRLRQIHAETATDFSAGICRQARPSDLDPDAVALFRTLWHRKSPTQGIDHLPDDRLLSNAELLVSGELTWAALILLGSREALGRLLGQAEVVFEYRAVDAPGPAADRREFRAGFLPVLDQIWQAINLRNDLQHFQQGLFVWDIPTFDEAAVREALLNAVSHRDYSLGGSVFVRQYPRRIEMVSPGGFPPGITQQNLLWEQNPRNRRLAEAVAKCGLVERSGQGFDLMYSTCIRQGKPLPDFSRTGESSVWVTLHGEVQGPEVVRFFEEIGRERLADFRTEDFLVVDLVHREQPIPDHLKQRCQFLLNEGIIERVGRGRGVRHLLSRRFFRFLGKGGIYTRRKGLDRAANKELLFKHIEDSKTDGATMSELEQVLPALSRGQVRSLLRDLRRDGRVEVRGTTRAARWFGLPKKPNQAQ